MSLNTLRELLVCAPVLTYPDFAQEFQLECDASESDLGAVLSRKQSDGSVECWRTRAEA